MVGPERRWKNMGSRKMAFLFRLSFALRRREVLCDGFGLFFPFLWLWKPYIFLNASLYRSSRLLAKVNWLLWLFVMLVSKL